MTSIELKAHAKVNLFLKVLNKRNDSYHNILTIFERISLCDKIRISKIPEGIIVSSDRFITADPKDNLVYKAARAILKSGRADSGVRIRIEKKIPLGGGLGGGSSDAAAVLAGVNKLFNLKLKRNALMKLAGRLGADVPFFLLDRPFAVGRSRGDSLKEISSKKRFWHLLIYPSFKLSTKEAYEAFDAEHLSNPSTGSGFDPELIEGSKHLTIRRDGVRIFLPLIKSTDFDAVESMLYNDLEKTARSRYDIIDHIIKRLAFCLGKKAILSGSGPSLFCLYRTRKEAVKGKEMLFNSVAPRERKPWRVFIVKTEP